MKNKEKAIERLDAIEAEAKELRLLINEPEQRTPEAGDVWEGASGSPWLITDHAPRGVCCATVRMGFNSGQTEPLGEIIRVGTYLGKFSEVYVKIADVRDALSIKDSDGDSLLHSNHRTKGVDSATIIVSREALAKLGITAKSD